jgi:hypothetical protein
MRAAPITVLQLGDDRDRSDQLHSAHRLQRLDDRRERPGGQQIAQGLLELGDARGRAVDSLMLCRYSWKPICWAG